MAAAKRIVAKYREEAPDGCDPQATYAAIAGAVVAAAGTGYSMWSQSKAQKERNSALSGGTQLFDPQQLDLQAVLGNLLGSNTQNFGQAAGLAAAGNDFNFGQFMKTIKKIQPSFKGIQSQVGQNALSFSRGELPQDTIESIQRAAAQTGIQGGYGFGSQGGKTGALANLNLRNLGLTSLDLTKYGTNLGIQVNQSAKGLMPQLGSAFDWLFTPAQGLQAETFNMDWMNRAGLANTSALNTLTGNLADSSYASALNSAATIQEGGNQLSSLLGTYGKNQSAKGTTGQTWRQNASGGLA